MKILITGMAGSGKTTIVRALVDKGYKAVDLDDTNLCTWIHRETGERVKYPSLDQIKHGWKSIVGVPT